MHPNPRHRGKGPTMKHNASTARRITPGTNPVTVVDSRASQLSMPLAPAYDPTPAANASNRVPLPRRSRRSLEQVLESLPTEIEEAAYAMQRIGALELRIAKIFRQIGPEARASVLKNRPDLDRYVVAVAP